MGRESGDVGGPLTTPVNWKDASTNRNDVLYDVMFVFQDQFRTDLFLGRSVFRPDETRLGLK